MRKSDYLEDTEPVNEEYMVAEPEAEGGQDSVEYCGDYLDGAAEDE